MNIVSTSVSGSTAGCFDIADVDTGQVVEEIVAGVFADILSVDAAVGADDDFFDLGGNSLVAVRLATALSEALTESVSIADIFGAKTVRRLADVISGDGEESQALSPWFPLRHHEHGIPVLCFHPAGGLG